MKPLSERLEEEAAAFKIIEWSEHSNIADDRHSDETKALLREAATLAKSVETAATGEVWQHAYIGGQRSSSIVITREPEDGLAIMGQRVALVPLPQQSES